ncbi:hypothetical protein BZA05DRAFT_448681 [Tricharina praecox]|uniref:uncharacterized protein n=1 Tax=Tricharina praecox TaxID=43433 RepID=UPI00221F6356|nr:uncharacterized protein BZA05DRAFT_448681 [Tricharina praecox]KAI5843773.1 hypothetical protein BZA05DRAFT_448681 [Tricharina praecox]
MAVVAVPNALPQPEADRYHHSSHHDRPNDTPIRLRGRHPLRENSLVDLLPVKRSIPLDVGGHATRNRPQMLKRHANARAWRYARTRREASIVSLPPELLLENPPGLLLGNDLLTLKAARLPATPHRLLLGQQLTFRRQTLVILPDVLRHEGLRVLALRQGGEGLDFDLGSASRYWSKWQARGRVKGLGATAQWHEERLFCWPKVAA